MQTLNARNGREALELLRQGITPDVALIDIVMPGLSSLELLGAIKEEDPGLQVIMVTAHGTTDRAIKAMKLGAYDYIQKPFDIPRMWETIRKALQVVKSVRSPVSYQTDQRTAGKGKLPFRKISWKASSSAMKKGHSQERITKGSTGLNRRTMGPSFWTKSVICPSMSRPKSSGLSRKGKYRGWGVPKPSNWMSD
jgi:YesN/AraC family two-component response regulator